MEDRTLSRGRGFGAKDLAVWRRGVSLLELLGIRPVAPEVAPRRERKRDSLSVAQQKALVKRRAANRVARRQRKVNGRAR